MMYYMQTLGEKGKIMHTWNIKEKGVESVLSSMRCRPVRYLDTGNKTIGLQTPPKPQDVF